MTRSNTIAAILLVGASLVGGMAATAASDTGAERRAAAQAKDAGKALASHKTLQAVTAAEEAVALSPRNAGYRKLLGQAYLASGRFVSAVGALSDALSLDPADGGAALHLALAQIATGDWSAARGTLDQHSDTIPASDRGLALALAGDPAAAVAVLTQASRTPGADAKTRQNLALSLALSGRWAEAKIVAAVDVSPGEVDKRIMQWATFAKPRSAADQVAALLGVTPVEDAGQPQQLALNQSAPSVAAVAQRVDTVDAFMPGQPTAAAVAAATPVAEAAPVMVGAAPEAGFVNAVEKSSVSFAPRREVVQALPVRVAAPRRAVASTGVVTPIRVATPVTAPAARPLARGNFHVQLGAFQNSGVARDAWGRIARRHHLNGYQPYGTSVTVNSGSFYRLSVGGFARGDADSLCRKVRNAGGVCFVRASAGDAIASWSRPGVQLASR